MVKDRNGNELKQGDRVYIPCTVKTTFPSAEGQAKNIDLVPEVERSIDPPIMFHLHGSQIEKAS